MRYGAQARCDNYRITADELEQPMRQAVLEFYSTGCDLISSAAGMAPGRLQLPRLARGADPAPRTYLTLALIPDQRWRCCCPSPIPPAVGTWAGRCPTTCSNT